MVDKEIIDRKLIETLKIGQRATNQYLLFDRTLQYL